MCCPWRWSVSTRLSRLAAAGSTQDASRVRVGEPIPYDPHSTPEQTTQKLHAAMARLLD